MQFDHILTFSVPTAGWHCAHVGVSLSEHTFLTFLNRINRFVLVLEPQCVHCEESGNHQADVLVLQICNADKLSRLNRMLCDSVGRPSTALLIQFILCLQ
jgi:hypothetical protein